MNPYSRGFGTVASVPKSAALKLPKGLPGGGEQATKPAALGGLQKRTGPPSAAPNRNG